MKSNLSCSQTQISTSYLLKLNNQDITNSTETILMAESRAGFEQVLQMRINETKRKNMQHRIATSSLKIVPSEEQWCKNETNIFWIRSTIPIPDFEQVNICF